MALLSDKLRSSGVKVSAIVGGVPSFGSGVIYATPNSCSYNYILTAKHIFQEDSRTDLDMSKIFNIEIQYSVQDQFKRLAYIKKADIAVNLITFDEDFAIVVVEKKDGLSFEQIFVSDQFEDEDLDFFSWGTFNANPNQLQHFTLKRNDKELKRFHLEYNHSGKHLPGLSGAGVFHKNKSVLCGIIRQYINEDFQNETVDCTLISFSLINSRLKYLNKVELDTHDSQFKREINDNVVYIHEALINEVSLDLELARKRLRTDIEDDWYHDPLKYIDLLNQDYIFKQFEAYFGKSIYEASLAEKFFVPKKQFTLRLALVSPFVDRVMYMAAVGKLAKRLDDAMIPNVYSARYNHYSDSQLILNGVEQWKKMKYKLAECAFKKDDKGYKYNCVVEIDLLNFYDNINKSLLYEKIKRVCETANEKRAANLLYNIICKISGKELGLPQNSDASSLLASFYLNQVDIFMLHHSPEYFRFMDDIRIFCSDKYEARRILQTFEFELRRCDLSVNSQKTKIYSLVDDVKNPGEEKSRNEFRTPFDFDLNKIRRLRKSENYTYLNDAFHLSIVILEKALSDVDINNSDESSRRINYALNTICQLGQKNINLYTQDSRFEKAISVAVQSLKDKPWITTQVCNVLNLLPTPTINSQYLNYIKEIVLKSSYNTYSFQVYQLWLLLAKHKCKSADLLKYAISQIEKNDETNRPVIAAMIIYLCSVDPGYRRVVLRKLGENFAHGYFQARIALISLRSFETDILALENIDNSLKDAHPFTHKFKDKDLVYVKGFDEDEESTSDEFEQLYSI